MSKLNHDPFGLPQRQGCVAPQVKSVVHQLPSDVDTSLEGLIAEYQFWKQRSDELQSLLLQINSKGLNMSIPS